MDSPCSSSQIVLAEDNPADVWLVRDALREHDIHCELRVIADGEEVLAFIDQLDSDTKLPCPDLFLLDLRLPKRDGVEILEYLRASERCRQTPVVVITSSDSIRDQRKAEKNAATRYFQKPTSLREFMQLGTIIKEVLSGNNPAGAPAESFKNC
jgi:two-component system, chemotaxis family, response regulator Rcp1